MTGGDDFLAPQAQTIDSSFKLKLESSNSLTHTDFYFNSNAGEGLDIGYDVGTYANLASSFSLYSKLASGEYFETNFAIQTIHNFEFRQHMTFILSHLFQVLMKCELNFNWVVLTMYISMILSCIEKF